MHNWPRRRRACTGDYAVPIAAQPQPTLAIFYPVRGLLTPFVF